MLQVGRNALPIYRRRRPNARKAHAQKGAVRGYRLSTYHFTVFFLSPPDAIPQPNDGRALLPRLAASGFMLG